MARYSFYIDGFNMYYALQQRYPHYKWIDYRKLAEQFVRAPDTIAGVVYFSAFVRWKPDAVSRHETYIRALRHAGVEFVKGRFLNKVVQCHLCHKHFKTHEEKQTDVNMALRVVADAVQDRFDRAVIVSADSDLIPAIRTVRRLAPEKEVGVLLPIGRTSNELRTAADFVRMMKVRHLKRSQFPERFTVGKTTLQRPPQWA